MAHRQIKIKKRQQLFVRVFGQCIPRHSHIYFGEGNWTREVFKKMWEEKIVFIVWAGSEWMFLKIECGQAEGRQVSDPGAQRNGDLIRGPRQRVIEIWKYDSNKVTEKWESYYKEGSGYLVGRTQSLAESRWTAVVDDNRGLVSVIRQQSAARRTGMAGPHPQLEHRETQGRHEEKQSHSVSSPIYTFVNKELLTLYSPSSFCVGNTVSGIGGLSWEAYEMPQSVEKCIDFARPLCFRCVNWPQLARWNRMTFLITHNLCDSNRDIFFKKCNPRGHVCEVL